MICLSSAGSLASFDGGSKGPTPETPRRPAGRWEDERRKRTRQAGRVPLIARACLARPRRGETQRSSRRSEGTAAPLTRRDAHRARGSADATLPLGDARSLSRRGRRCESSDRGGHDRARAGRAPRRVEAPLEEACSQAEPGSASCVQRFDDSLNSAIRTTYRISLRSSSLREPRYPSTRVVWFTILERLASTRHARLCGAHTLRSLKKTQKEVRLRCASRNTERSACVPVNSKPQSDEPTENTDGTPQ